MEVIAHTTPESRQALRKYLRDRRMTTSVHQTITAQTLNDLEEAIQMLRAALVKQEGWSEEAASFLSMVCPAPRDRSSSVLPGILDSD